MWGATLAAGNRVGCDLHSLAFESKACIQNTPLPLNLHKAGRCAGFDFVPLYDPGYLDEAGKQQEFFCQGSFFRIGVANDTESAPAAEFFKKRHRSGYFF